jgi:hypothetical protein
MADRPATTDRANDEAVELATRWLIETPLERRPVATTALLREMFGLTDLQACDAIRASIARHMGGTHGAS